jgi:hypothetical protein
MSEEQATLVLAPYRPLGPPRGLIVTDDPAAIRDPGQDVLLDDIILSDRYDLRRYEGARRMFESLPQGRFPRAREDYAYAYAEAFVDLAHRLDRLRLGLRKRGLAAIHVPQVEDRTAWAATAFVREDRVRLESYGVEFPRGRLHAAELGSRLALKALGPLLLARFRRQPLRLLTTDLGLTDSFVGHCQSGVGILSPGLGVAARLRRGRAKHAWLPHPSPHIDPVAYRDADLSEAALRLALHAGATLPFISAPAARAISSGDVHVVVLPDDKAPLNHALARVAGEAGVPSLVIQHGITGHPIGFLPLRASRFASWGERCTQWMVRHGTPRGRIVATGNPKFDHLFAARADLRERGRAWLRRAGLPDGQPIALFLSQPIEGRFAALRQCVEGTADGPFRLVTKTHPAERAEAYRAHSHQGGRTSVVLAGPPEPLLCAADVVLTQSSGLAVAAAQLGIPVILLESVHLEGADPYDERWPRAEDARSLRAWLLAVSGADYDLAKVRRLGEEYGGPADGQAGRRVADLVRILASRGAGPGSPDLSDEYSWLRPPTRDSRTEIMDAPENLRPPGSP